jgi:hypothetical protein
MPGNVDGPVVTYRHAVLAEAGAVMAERPSPDIAGPAGSATPPLHPALAPLAGYLGVFEGPGHGDYPTIAAFDYHERVSFAHVGKPFLVYAQRTWQPETGAPMHAEQGYLRVVGTDRIELVLAHPTGIVEVQEGTVDAGVLELRSTVVEGSSTAKRVRSLRRRFTLDDDVLTYDLWMAYAEVPETHHLHAELRRHD